MIDIQQVMRICGIINHDPFFSEVDSSLCEQFTRPKLWRELIQKCQLQIVPY